MAIRSVEASHKHEKNYQSGIGLVIEEIEESGQSLESGLLSVFDFDNKLNLRFAGTSEVDDVVEIGNQSDPAPGDNRLSEFHLVHSVVNHHLEVINLDDLVPHIGQ